MHKKEKMLYNNFIVCMMTVAFFALIDMIVNEHWAYIILPIGILIWGIFKFFDENDRKYLEGMGIDPDEFNAFFPDYYDTTYKYGRNRHSSSGSSSYPSHTSYNNGGGTVNKNTITWNSPTDTYRREPNGSTYGGFFGGQRRYNNPAYKGMAKKCKRNFKITVEQKTEEDESKRERVHHGINSFLN